MKTSLNPSWGAVFIQFMTPSPRLIFSEFLPNASFIFLHGISGLVDGASFFIALVGSVMHTKLLFIHWCITAVDFLIDAVLFVTPCVLISITYVGQHSPVSP